MKITSAASLALLIIASPALSQKRGNDTQGGIELYGVMASYHNVCRTITGDLDDDVVGKIAKLAELMGFDHKNADQNRLMVLQATKGVGELRDRRGQPDETLCLKSKILLGDVVKQAFK